MANVTVVGYLRTNTGDQTSIVGITKSNITKYSLPETFVIMGRTLSSMGVFYATLSGLISGVLIGLLSEYYTSFDFKPTRRLAKSAKVD